jgi:tetratricopeptide (TPR) repeat protein
MSLCTIILTQTCEELITQGDKYYEAYDNPSALKLYQQAYLQCPGSFEAMVKFGQLLNDVGLQKKGENARKYFSRALELSNEMIQEFGDSAQSYFLKSYSAANLALASGGRTKVRLSRLVVDNAKKSIALDSDYVRPYVVLGGYFREVATASGFLKGLARIFYGSIPEGTLEDSEQILQKALSLDPNNIYAHYELAQTYIEMGRRQDARYHLQTVMDLHPTNFQAKQIQKKSREMLERIG